MQYILKGKRHIFAWVLEFEHIRTTEAEEDEEPEEEDRRITKSLAGLAVALAIIVVGLFLAEHLKTLSDIEDCMLAHHTSCTEIH